MKNFIVLKICGNKNQNLFVWGWIALVCVILIAICIFTPRMFDSPSTVINEMSMDPNYNEMSYSELNNKLIVTRDDSEEIEFKLTEGSYAYLRLRLVEENVSWGGWTFEHKEMPAGENHTEYLVYYGTRKPKQ